MVKTTLKFAVSIAVLGVLFALTDTMAILERLRGADLAWLGVALVCLTGLTFLMAWRWQLTAQALDLDLGYSRAVKEYYLAQLLNLVLPGGVAGDATRAVRLRKDGDLLRAAQSVMIERLIGQIALFGMMFVGFLGALIVPSGMAWPVWTWGVLGAAIVVAFAFGLYARRQGAVAKFLTTAFALMRQPQQIALSVAIALLISLSFYACALATGTTLPVAALFTLIPLILTSMLIPLSVGGWGWREGAAAALFPLAGALPSAGIATGIAYGTVMLIAALPAAFFMFFSSNGSQSGPNTVTDV